MEKEVVDLVMLSYTKNERYYNMTTNAIRSLKESESDFEFNIYLIETNTKLIEEFPNGYPVTVITPNIPFNYNKFLNIGLERCHNKYVVIANNDVIFRKRWFSILSTRMEENNAVSACPYWDGYFQQFRGLQVPYIWTGYEVGKQVHGFCIVVKREILDTVKFDERFSFWYQDNDYAKQLQFYGYKHILVRESMVDHLGRSSHELLESRYHEATKGMKKIFQDKWNAVKKTKRIDNNPSPPIPVFEKKSPLVSNAGRIIKNGNSSVNLDNTAIFLHLFYYDLWEEISIYLKQTKFKFSLYVNLVKKAGWESIEKKILKDFPLATIIVSPNRGLDIGGQLQLINEWLKDGAKEEWIVFLHGKKSLNNIKKDKDFGDNWRKELFEIIEPQNTGIISKYFSDPRVGMIGNKKWIFSNLSREYKVDTSIESNSLKQYLDRFNITTSEKTFVGGTMFWVRSSIYRDFFTQNNPLHIYSELEPSDEMPFGDSTNTHAMERILGYIVGNRGFKIMGLDKRYSDLGMNIVSIFETSKGISEVPRQISTSLLSVDIPIVKIDESKIKNRIPTPYFFNLLSINADQTPRISGLLSNAYGGDFFKRYTIGFWFWELAKFPKEWEKAFNNIDELWVASPFCYDLFKKIAPINKPITKIPSPIVVSPFIKSPNREKYNIRKDTFIFFFAFDFQSLFDRKNPLGIVDAYRKAFEGTNSDVHLILKASYSKYDPVNLKKLQNTIRSLPSNIPVTLIDGIIDKEDVMNLMNICDCYISLHRSEGFGLTLGEAMGFGKPCIATGFSGNMEFMNSENSYLVDYTMSELKKNVGPYERGAVWADPNIDMAAEYMRYVYNNRDEAIKKGQIAKKHIEENYSYKAIGDLMKNRLLSLYR